MKRALVVAFHFTPESTSGTHRSLHFARGLVDAGIEVTVLTRTLDSLDRVDEALDGVFPWPDRIVRVDSEELWLDRVVPPIRRRLLGGAAPRSAGTSGGREGVPFPSPETDPGRQRTGDGSRFARSRWLLNEIRRHPDVHRGWYRPAVRAGRTLLRTTPFDLVFASGPPWTGLRVGAALGAEHGVPFVADFRDPWTRLSGRDAFSRGFLFDRLRERQESRVVGRASLVLTNSPGVTAALIERRDSLDSAKVVTILNGSDARRRSVASPFPTEVRPTVRHFGSLYGGRNIVPLARAAALRAGSGTAWSIEQYGESPERVDLERMPAEARATLSVLPPIPFTAAVDVMHEPGILTVIQPASFERQVPTKLYDYLCTGNPILVLAPERSATWAVARRFDRCVRADPDDETGIATILEKLETDLADGTLMQVAADRDTDGLRKRSVSEAFLRQLRGIAGETGPTSSSVLP